MIITIIALIASVVTIFIFVMSFFKVKKACQKCPANPTCPTPSTCPKCPTTPTCPTCPTPTCPACPTCPTPTCPKCPAAPACPTCPTPTCPACPTGGGGGGGGAFGLYSISKNWKGADLVPSQTGEWTYFTGQDPTNGKVRYGSNSNLLTRVGDSLKIDVGQTVQPYGTRDAIRINTTSTYNYGVFVVDVDHMPEGLGVWPAFWLLGDGIWACGGEIDIIEGVNSVDARSSINESTLHTSAPCIQADGANCNSTGNPAWTSCGCTGTEQCPTNGCPKIFSKQNSFGWGFNRKTPRGGIFATELTQNGQINIWYFEDKSKAPSFDGSSINLKLWGTPTVQFLPCKGRFSNMRIIINTTLCGDWAGETFNDGKGNVGRSKCEGAIADSSYTLEDAYWLINWVKIYQ